MAEEIIRSWKHWTPREVMFHFARVGIAIVLFISALPKLLDTRSFAYQLQNYAILPQPLNPIFAATLPWLEFVLALLVLLNLIAQDALLLTSILLCGYCAAQVLAFHRGLKIDCGCGLGQRSEIVSPFTIGRTLLLLFVTIDALRLARKREA